MHRRNPSPRGASVCDCSTKSPDTMEEHTSSFDLEKQTGRRQVREKERAKDKARGVRVGGFYKPDCKGSFESKIRTRQVAIDVITCQLEVIKQRKLALGFLSGIYRRAGP